jgi:hypothetical protein
MTLSLFATVVMLLKKNWQHFTQQVMVKTVLEIILGLSQVNSNYTNHKYAVDGALKNSLGKNN